MKFWVTLVAAETKLTKEIIRPHLVAAVGAVDLQSSGTTTARTSQKPAKCQFSNKITWQERERTRRVRYK